mmetsp:Transcript_52824/g.114704  ORF Transcript_52824/g.114704 Transcript_52824/m.114704 type:complete len:97 (-) Transcript_52824:44-334(-)
MGRDKTRRLVVSVAAVAATCIIVCTLELLSIPLALRRDIPDCQSGPCVGSAPQGSSTALVDDVQYFDSWSMGPGWWILIVSAFLSLANPGLVFFAF